jgi:hypothetical protein
LSTTCTIILFYLFQNPSSAVNNRLGRTSTWMYILHLALTTSRLEVRSCLSINTVSFNRLSIPPKFFHALSSFNIGDSQSLHSRYPRYFRGFPVGPGAGIQFDSCCASPCLYPLATQLTQLFNCVCFGTHRSQKKKEIILCTLWCLAC